MKFNRALIVGLAVLMILISVCMVSAADTNATDDDNSDDVPDEEDIVENDTDDTVPEVVDTGVVNGTLPLEPDNASVNASYSLSKVPTQQDNDTKNATTNTAADKHATGNPLLILLVAVAGIGTASLRRRK